jgi:flavodoxin
MHIQFVHTHTHMFINTHIYMYIHILYIYIYKVINKNSFVRKNMYMVYVGSTGDWSYNMDLCGGLYRIRDARYM